MQKKNKKKTNSSTCKIKRYQCLKKHYFGSLKGQLFKKRETAKFQTSMISFTILFLGVVRGKGISNFMLRTPPPPKSLTRFIILNTSAHCDGFNV